MFTHKFTRREGHRVLAVCDEELLDDEISDENMNLEVSEEFYGEDPISDSEVLEKASESTVINAVGNEVVNLLLQNDFFDENKILKVDGISHAQMVKI